MPAPKMSDFTCFNSPFCQRFLCMSNNNIAMLLGRINQRKLYIWPIFTCVNMMLTSAIPSANIYLLCFCFFCPGVCCLVRPLYLTIAPGWPKIQGADWSHSWRSVQPYMVRWQEPYTVHCSCIFATETSWLCSLTCPYVYRSIDPLPWWEDGNRIAQGPTLSAAVPWPLRNTSFLHQ